MGRKRQGNGGRERDRQTEWEKRKRNSETDRLREGVEREETEGGGKQTEGVGRKTDWEIETVRQRDYESG